MKVFAISDLHLSINNPKPMDIFGGAWDNYVAEIEEDWQKRVGENDVVLIAGDVSWAMLTADAKPDLDYIAKLNGNKVILRGNHDYWWKSISSVRKMLSGNTYAVQNDCVKVGDVVICGTRLWATSENGEMSAQDKAIYERENIRLGLSIEAAKKVITKGDRVVVMTHYPPFNSKIERTPFIEQISAFMPNAVVYGHLHGRVKRAMQKTEIDGVPYYLTSCDLVGNKLVQIL